MAILRRFGVSMEPGLLKEFDALIRQRGYANRSDALRALVRSHLLDRRVEERPTLEVVGTITLVYDHGTGDLPNRLTEIQHRSHTSIISTLHVHIDARNCLEVLVVRGKLAAVRAIADTLCGTRGVHQGKLLVNTDVGPAVHPHHHPPRRSARRREPS